jgi:hypothetical protein
MPAIPIVSKIQVLFSEKNKNLVKLSCEEKYMDWAPEGELYQVDIINDADL